MRNQASNTAKAVSLVNAELVSSFTGGVRASVSVRARTLATSSAFRERRGSCCSKVPVEVVLNICSGSRSVLYTLKLALAQALAHPVVLPVELPVELERHQILPVALPNWQSLPVAMSGIFEL